jgi:hypothetical protein
LKIFRAILIASCLASMLPAYAADDDLTSSAYLVFDPETGEFVTVQDPDRSKQDHAARDPANVAGNHPPTADSVRTTPTASGVAMTLVLIAAVVWLQSRKAKVS